MTIVKNSAKCAGCGKEIESTHRHDFKGHACVDSTGKRFEFYVDGGRAYIRRVGAPSDYIETSIHTNPE